MKYLKELFKALQDQNQAKACDLLEAIWKEWNALEYVEPILAYMRVHSRADYGNPGPAVLFLEKFTHRGYERRLLASLEDKPTKTTLEMADRLLRVPGLKNPELYISCLENISKDQALETGLREQARGYCLLHARGAYGKEIRKTTGIYTKA